MKDTGVSAFFQRSIAYPLGVLCTTSGLLTLLVFVVYECIRTADVVSSVPQVLAATFSGFLMVLVGFSLMVAGSEGHDVGNKESNG